MKPYKLLSTVLFSLLFTTTMAHNDRGRVDIIRHDMHPSIENQVYKDTSQLNTRYSRKIHDHRRYVYHKYDRKEMIHDDKRNKKVQKDQKYSSNHPIKADVHIKGNEKRMKTKTK